MKSRYRQAEVEEKQGLAKRQCTEEDPVFTESRESAQEETREKAKESSVY